MELGDRRIIVTGGARGIGAATARAYVAAGARVAVLDILDEAGEALVNALNRAGPGSARYHHCDIAHRPEVDRIFDAVVAEFGGLDVLANIAGVERHTPAEAITDSEWDLIFDVNVRGTLLTNQAAYRHMKDRGGRILNFGSDAGLVPYVNGAHYSAAKGAVFSWTRTIAHEWGRHGVTANALVPALWTPMYEEHRATFDAEQLAAHDAMMAGLIPVGGKLGDPDTDFAPFMVFMAGEGARFINGQILSVNGGLNTVR